MQINGLSRLHAAQAINGPHQPQSTPPTKPSTPVAGADELDLSPQASLIDQVKAAPDIRVDRVADIRAQIEAGVYATDEKLDIALDRLLEELT